MFSITLYRHILLPTWTENSQSVSVNRDRDKLGCGIVVVWLLVTPEFTRLLRVCGLLVGQLKTYSEQRQLHKAYVKAGEIIYLAIRRAERQLSLKLTTRVTAGRVLGTQEKSAKVHVPAESCEFGRLQPVQWQPGRLNLQCETALSTNVLVCCGRVYWDRLYDVPSTRLTNAVVVDRRQQARETLDVRTWTFARGLWQTGCSTSSCRPVWSWIRYLPCSGLSYCQFIVLEAVCLPGNCLRRDESLSVVFKA